MIYHIYVNNTCVRACLNVEEFHREWKYLQTFLELTNHKNDARLEFVECESPNNTLEASY